MEGEREQLNWIKENSVCLKLREEERRRKEQTHIGKTFHKVNSKVYEKKIVYLFAWKREKKLKKVCECVSVWNIKIEQSLLWRIRTLDAWFMQHKTAAH